MTFFCRGGTFGTVRVHYTTYAVDAVDEATADGTSVLDYYNSPLSGTPLPLAAQSGTSWDVTAQPEPLVVCTTPISLVELLVKYFSICLKKICHFGHSFDLTYLAAIFHQNSPMECWAGVAWWHNWLGMDLMIHRLRCAVHHCVLALGKLLTPVCLCHQSV